MRCHWRGRTPYGTLAAMEAELFSFRFLQVHGKKLTVSLFRQLPVVELCNEDGERRADLIPFAVVRYKHDGENLWALARQEAGLVRCPLHPGDGCGWLQERICREEELSQMPGLIDSVRLSIMRSIEKCRRDLIVEPRRHAAHAAAARLEQVYL